MTRRSARPAWPRTRRRRWTAVARSSPPTPRRPTSPSTRASAPSPPRGSTSPAPTACPSRSAPWPGAVPSRPTRSRRTRRTSTPCPPTRSAVERHPALRDRSAARRADRGDGTAACRVCVEGRPDAPVAGALPARGDARDPRGDRLRRLGAPPRGARRPAAPGVVPRGHRGRGRRLHHRRRRRRPDRQAGPPQPPRLRCRTPAGDATEGAAGGVPAERPNAATVNEVWEAIKASEKQRTSVLDGLPPTLPALLLADKVLDRLSRLPDEVSVLAPRGVTSCDAEPSVVAGRTVRSGEGTADPAEDIGERLLALVAEARDAGVDPEQALRDVVRRLA